MNRKENFMAKHQFGIIEQFEENKVYKEYEPEKYKCIPISIHLMDYVIDSYSENWKKVKTYLSSSLHQFYGLDESGITIIPPESLNLSRDIIIDANSKVKQTQLIYLINKIEEAIKNDKYIIHFGI